MKKKEPAKPKKRPRNDLSYKAKGIAKKKAEAAKKLRKPRVSRVPKTRNAGTQTEASFWGGINNFLRQKSRFWKPVAKVRNSARRAYSGPNKKQRFEYQCNHCKLWFKNTDVQVDHITPVGSLKCGDDLKPFIERLFCEEEGLQVLCTECHKIKTKTDIEMIRGKNQEINGIN